MAESPGTDGQPPEKAETAWERRKRLAAVFGDVLPETTSDDRDDDTPATRGDSDPGDEWLRAQVPPHHG